MGDSVADLDPVIEAAAIEARRLHYNFTDDGRWDKADEVIKQHWRKVAEAMFDIIVPEMRERLTEAVDSRGVIIDMLVPWIVRANQAEKKLAEMKEET